jgi:DNA-binding transcriptional regulator LsrR (DeoR family)
VSKPLAITERQARTLLRAADKERGIVEVKIGDTVVRLIPEILAQPDRRIDEDGDFRL